jgi:putative flippase GtrA
MSKYKQVLVFLSVGLISAIINFLTFYLTWHILALDYKLSATIAYVVAVLIHFLGNRHITFKSKEDLAPQIKKYALLLLLNYVATLLIISISVNWLNLSPYLGLCLAILTTVGLGFIISKRFVFMTA